MPQARSTSDRFPGFDRQLPANGQVAMLQAAVSTCSLITEPYQAASLYNAEHHPLHKAGIA